jgi:hypothetical protein
VRARDGFGLCSCGAGECRHLRAALVWANAELGTVAPELMGEAGSTRSEGWPGGAARCRWTPPSRSASTRRLWTSDRTPSPAGRSPAAWLRRRRRDQEERARGAAARGQARAVRKRPRSGGAASSPHDCGGRRPTPAPRSSPPWSLAAPRMPARPGAARSPISHPAGTRSSWPRPAATEAPPRRPATRPAVMEAGSSRRAPVSPNGRAGR